MRRKVEKFRKRIEFRDAFDCKANVQCVQYYSRARSHFCVLGVCGKTFSKGAVGILYSLNATLSELLVSGVEEVTVMEDDIYFRKEAIEVADKLWKHNRSAHMFYLGTQSSHLPNVEIQGNVDERTSFYLTETTQGFQKTMFRNFTYGLYGVILRRPMMRAFQQAISWVLAFPSRMIPADNLLNYVILCLKMPVPVMYPSLILPEVRESDNMGARDIHNFSRDRNLNYSSAEQFSAFSAWNEMGNLSALLPPDQLWGVNGFLGPNLQSLNAKGADFLKYTTFSSSC